VKYKAVMQEYGLGPNGAILTCLNLLCTKFDQACDNCDMTISTVFRSSHCGRNGAAQFPMWFWTRRAKLKFSLGQPVGQSLPALWPIITQL